MCRDLNYFVDFPSHLFYCDSLIRSDFGVKMKPHKKVIQIPYHPPAPKTKKTNNAPVVSQENLLQAYAQMNQLEEMVQQHIPILEVGIQQRDFEIKKLRAMSKLKDEELQKLRTK